MDKNDIRAWHCQNVKNRESFRQICQTNSYINYYRRTKSMCKDPTPCLAVDTFICSCCLVFVKAVIDLWDESKRSCRFDWERLMDIDQQLSFIYYGKCDGPRTLLWSELGFRWLLLKVMMLLKESLLIPQIPLNRSRILFFWFLVQPQNVLNVVDSEWSIGVCPGFGTLEHAWSHMTERVISMKLDDRTCDIHEVKWQNMWYPWSHMTEHVVCVKWHNNIMVSMKSHDRTNDIHEVTWQNIWYPWSHITEHVYPWSDMTTCVVHEVTEHRVSMKWLDST